MEKILLGSCAFTLLLTMQGSYCSRYTGAPMPFHTFLYQNDIGDTRTAQTSRGKLSDFQSEPTPIINTEDSNLATLYQRQYEAKEQGRSRDCAIIEKMIQDKLNESLSSQGTNPKFPSLLSSSSSSSASEMEVYFGSLSGMHNIDSFVGLGKADGSNLRCSLGLVNVGRGAQQKRPRKSSIDRIYQQRIAGVTQKNNELVDENKKLKFQMEEMKLSLKRDNNKLEKIVREFQKQTIVLQQERDELIVENNKLRSQTEILQKKLKEQLTLISQLQKQIVQKDAEQQVAVTQVIFGVKPYIDNMQKKHEETVETLRKEVQRLQTEHAMEVETLRKRLQQMQQNEYLLSLLIHPFLNSGKAQSTAFVSSPVFRPTVSPQATMRHTAAMTPSSFLGFQNCCASVPASQNQSPFFTKSDSAVDTYSPLSRNASVPPSPLKMVSSNFEYSPANASNTRFPGSLPPAYGVGMPSATLSLPNSVLPSVIPTQFGASPAINTSYIQSGSHLSTQRTPVSVSQPSNMPSGNIPFAKPTIVPQSNLTDDSSKRLSTEQKKLSTTAPVPVIASNSAVSESSHLAIHNQHQEENISKEENQAKMPKTKSEGQDLDDSKSKSSSNFTRRSLLNFGSSSFPSNQDSDDSESESSSSFTTESPLSFESSSFSSADSSSDSYSSDSSEK